MTQTSEPGQIIILNGVPRSGKSSIVAVIQETVAGVWMNLDIDRFMRLDHGPTRAAFQRLAALAAKHE
jgi:chloramphenicol 3-O phosphotransferase